MKKILAWLAIRVDRKEKMRREIAMLEDEYLERRITFSDEINKLRDALVRLWVQLTTNTTLPKSLEEYRNFCIPRIQSKLIERCILLFRCEVRRYNYAVETEINFCILKLMKYMSSSNVDEIHNYALDLREILINFNESQANPENAWNTKESIEAMEMELCQFLNNYVCAVQCEASFARQFEDVEKTRGVER